MSGAVDPAMLRALFVGSTAGAALFVLGVVTGWSDGADARLVAALRLAPFDPARRPPRLITAARDLSALGGDMLRGLFLAGCAIALFADKRSGLAWRLLAIVLVARLVLILLKRFARRVRPDPGHVATYTSSFPSGHTCMAAVLFVAAALLIPGPVPFAALVAALAVSLAIGVTRIMLGIHWPSDVAVGWLAGIAWATGWTLLAT